MKIISSRLPRWWRTTYTISGLSSEWKRRTKKWIRTRHNGLSRPPEVFQVFQFCSGNVLCGLFANVRHRGCRCGIVHSRTRFDDLPPFSWSTIYSECWIRLHCEFLSGTDVTQNGSSALEKLVVKNGQNWRSVSSNKGKLVLFGMLELIEKLNEWEWQWRHYGISMFHKVLNNVSSTPFGSYLLLKNQDYLLQRNV